MTPQEQIYNVLTTDASVSDMTTTVRPLYLSRDDALPAITYQSVSINPVTSIGGDHSNLDQTRMQVDVWSHKYNESMELYQAVRKAMRDKTKIKSNFIDVQETYNDETQRYRKTIDFYVWTQPQA